MLMYILNQPVQLFSWSGHLDITIQASCVHRTCKLQPACIWRVSKPCISPSRALEKICTQGTVSQLLHSYFMHSYITRRGSRAAGQWLLLSFVHSKWASQSYLKLVCRCLSQTVFKTKSVTGRCIPSPYFGAPSLLTKKMEASIGDALTY